MTPQPSPMLLAVGYSQPARHISNHPLSHSFSYRASPGHPATSDSLGLSSSHLPTVTLAHSGGGSPYDFRPHRPSDIEQMAGPSTMDHSLLETSASTSAVPRYECNYCGKGFNRPSSLKVCMACHQPLPSRELKKKPNHVIRYISTAILEKSVSYFALIDGMPITLYCAAFTCPFEGCGRSFSVLSNMRRHARVHTSVPHQSGEAFSDEGSE